MKIKVTGIQDISKANFELFSVLRPTGVCNLTPEPDNPYDKYAVRVDYEGTKLGYLQGKKENNEYVGSDVQKYVLEHDISTLPIAGYGYIDEDGNWNDKHIGRLQSVHLDLNVDNAPGSQIIGGDYMRVTEFISYLNTHGNCDGLIKWAFKQGRVYENYRTALAKRAEQGTEMHDCIYDYFEHGVREYDLPEGFGSFLAKYEPEFAFGEQRFYDSELMVTGQPDWVGYIDGKLTLIDWKSSKKPSAKHRIQVSIYAHNTQFDGQQVEQAMIVAFGAENKQRFSASVVKRNQIDNTYQIMKHFRKVVDGVCNTWS